jgi:hypothetical protein
MFQNLYPLFTTYMSKIILKFTLDDWWRVTIAQILCKYRKAQDLDINSLEAVFWDQSVYA